MKNSLKLPVMILLLACLTTGVLSGRLAYAQQERPQGRQQAPATEGRSQEGRTTPTETPREEWSVTDHTIQIGGQTIPYKASAGTTLLKNDAGEPTGMLYSVA